MDHMFLYETRNILYFGSESMKFYLMRICEFTCNYVKYTRTHIVLRIDYVYIFNIIYMYIYIYIYIYVYTHICTIYNIKLFFNKFTIFQLLSCY